jgi:hypothetical protein
VAWSQYSRAKGLRTDHGSRPAALQLHLDDGLCLSDLDRRHDRDALADWVWGLGRWGQHILARSGLCVARPALLLVADHRRREHEEWKHAFDVSVACESISALDRWTSDPAGAAPAVHRSIEPLRAVCRDSAFCLDEASGTGALVESRRRAGAAMASALHAVSVATWTPHEPSQTSSEEERARTAAGPSYHAWSAVDWARRALEYSNRELASRIRSGVLKLCIEGEGAS